MQNITHQKIETFVRQGNLTALKQLSEKFLFCIGKQGRNLLHLATHVGHPHIVSYLLEKGLDPYKRDNTGYTPYDYARDATVQAMLPKPAYPMLTSTPHLAHLPHQRVPAVPKTNHNLLSIFLMLLVGSGAGFVAFKNDIDYGMPSIFTSEVPALEQTLTTQEHALLTFAKTLEADTDTTKASKEPISDDHLTSLLFSKPFVIGVITLVFCGGLILLMPTLIEGVKLALNGITTLSRKLFILSLVASAVTISAVFGYFIIKGLATEWINKEKPNYPKGSLQGLKKGTGYLLNIKEEPKKQPPKKKGWFSYFKSTSKN